MVKFLIEGNYVDVNVQDEFGTTALILAAAKNKIPVLQYLLNNPVIDLKKTMSTCTALHFACQNGHAEAVRLILTHDKVSEIINLTSLIGTPLYKACMNDHYGVVKELLSYPGIDVNYVVKDEQGNHTTAFFAAVGKSHNIIDILLKDQRLRLNQRLRIMIAGNPVEMNELAVVLLILAEDKKQFTYIIKLIELGIDTDCVILNEGRKSALELATNLKLDQVINYLSNFRNHGGECS